MSPLRRRNDPARTAWPFRSSLRQGARPPTPRVQSGKLRRGLAITLALSLVLGVAVLWAWRTAPGWLLQQVQDRGSAFSGRPVRLQGLELSLQPLGVSLRELRICKAGAACDAAAQAELSVRSAWLSVNAGSLLRGVPEVQALAIDGLRLSVQRQASGDWSFDDLLTRLRSTGPEARGPSQGVEQGGQDRQGRAHLILRNLVISDATLEFDDRLGGRRHSVSALRLELPWLSTLPADADRPVAMSMQAQLDGQALTFSAQAHPFRPKPAAQGHLQAQALDLQPWWPWLPPGLPLQPVGGRLSADLRVRADLAGDLSSGSAPLLELQGRTDLSEMELRDAKGSASVSWSRLSVDWNAVRPLQQRVDVGEVRWEGLRAQVQRDARGQWSLPAFGAGATVPAATSSPTADLKSSPPSAAWTLSAGPVEIVDARLQLRDQATSPAVTSRVEPLSLRLQGLRWPLVNGADPLSPLAVSARASARLAVGDRKAAQVGIEAELAGSTVNATWRVGSLDLGALMPYLGPLSGLELQGLVQGSGGATLKLNTAFAGLSPSAWSLRVDALRLRDAQARKPGQTDMTGWRDLRVERLRLDPTAQRIDVARLWIDGPQMPLRRRSDGALDMPVWTPSAQPAPSAQSPWQIRLGQFSLNDGRMRWIDERVRDVESPAQPMTAALDGLQLQLDDFRWPPEAAPIALRLETGLQVGSGQARLQAQGRLGLQSSGYAGQVALQGLPLWRLEPYLADLGIVLPVRLSRGELGLSAQLDVARSPQGWQADVEGGVRLADVQWLARPRGLVPVDGSDELLSWNALQADPVRVRWSAGQTPVVRVGEIRLEDAFARLQITPQGRLNLQEVVELQGPLRPADESAPGAAAPDAAVGATTLPPAASTTAPSPARPAFDIAVEKTVLVNGRVDFVDRFINPNYRAELSELNGSFGRFESGSTALAPVELTGRAASTARVEIRGSVNPLADPLALDLSARLTDLELSPLSPYGAKYIGHAIERGKLSMDLSYRIEPDGRLQARNQLILNQLTLGERVQSASAVNWPIRFVLSLLADRNGVIDIDLPISGSIQDPQFSLWGLVWKVLGNLVTRVVTAPFSWLAGRGSAEARFVSFDAGSTAVASSAGAALDGVARALGDRPAMRLTLTGAADPRSEVAPLRAALLQERLRALWRREQARGLSLPWLRTSPPPAGSASALPPMPAAGTPQHLALLRQLYRESPLPNKPRNALGLLRDLPPDQMTAFLEAGIEVGEERLRELALARSVAVREALVARGLAPERIFVASPRLQGPAEAGSQGGGPPDPGARVELQLAVP